MGLISRVSSRTYSFFQMIDCTPSPTITRVQPPCNNGTPLGPPKRKKNVRVRKSIITDDLLSGGINAIKVTSENPKPYNKKQLNLIDNVTLKVQVNSTPSPKEDENNMKFENDLKFENNTSKITEFENNDFENHEFGNS